jgi:phosphoribosylamine--glycine ligase
VDYRGVLYAGLMVSAEGPRVLEYNVRFGDPETQVVLPRVDEDLTALLSEAAAGHLRTDPRPGPLSSVCVVLASSGYPQSPRTGDVIEGVEEAGEVPGVTVLHAGTALDDAGRLVTAGGRVLGVRAVAGDLEAARRSAYEAVSRIDWAGMAFRTDIAAQAAALEHAAAGARDRGAP